jgi:DNA primase
MAKIAQVAAKYIIHAKINIDGVVDRPDVIGAIFGQTEGLLGADLELRELQKSGRIGRIEVNVDTKSGKTNGEIIIPSSLDKAETSIVAAAVEIIQRIGPCNAKLVVSNIEDIRISKREAVINRAKELLRDLMYNSMPDSQELSEEVSQSVRVMEIVEFGREKLSAGPAIAESDEIILVEGRADVLTLLKHGFKNAIALNGTSVPQTIIDLSKEKTVTVFVDGDRGGMLIVQELLSSAELDYVCRAPDGKEVEELAKKEIHKALRARITAEQARLDISSGAFNTDVMNVKKSYNTQRDNREAAAAARDNSGSRDNRDSRDRRPQQTTTQRPQPSYQKPQPESNAKPQKPTAAESKKFSEMLEDLIGTRGAYILNDKLNILGKVPVTELQSTIKSLATGIYAIVFDGAIDKDLITASERANVKFLVGMESKTKTTSSVALFTLNDL